MASKDGNGLLISHAIFALLSVGLGVAWYFAWQQSSDLQRQFDSAKKAESEAYLYGNPSTNKNLWLTQL